MSIIDHIVIISMLGMFVFGVALYKRLYQLSLAMFFFSVSAIAVRQYGLEAVIYIPLALIGILVAVWFATNVIATVLWKSASKGTTDEGKPTPIDGGIKDILKSALGVSW